MSKQLIRMKNNLRMMNMVKKLATKVIPVMLVSIMSTEAFAGTYYISKLSEAPALIKADIEKQEDKTNIIYNGSETFSSKTDAVNMINALDEQAQAILSEFDFQNIYSVNVNGSTSEVSPGVFSVKVGQYIYGFKNSVSDLASADQIIDSAINDIKAVSTNKYETIQAIYDYVIKTYSYQKWASSDTDFPNVLNERNILFGLQGNGIVCDAYAMLMCRMLDKVGIENKFVMGTVQGELHIWNIVKLEGAWYHVDATWGDGSQSSYSKYFLAGDTNISNYHVWDKSEYPTTSTTAYDTKVLGNEILGKLQAIENKTYTTIPEVDTALNSLTTLKEQAIEVADTTLRGTVLSELSRIETGLDELKVTIGTNNEALLIQNATLAVETAETSLVLTDYNSALALVNALTDSQEKTDLINRLNAVYQAILAKEEAQRITLATQAVVTSEQSLLEADYNSALALVNALKDGSDKTALLNRLDAVRVAMDTQADNKALEVATKAVELAEDTYSRTDHANALSLVNTLKDSYDKDDLLWRLELVLVVIETEEELQVFEEATKAVILAEETLSLDDYNTALSLVSALNDSADKTNLLDRLSIVKNTIDNLNEAEKDDLALKKATEAVDKAEKTLLATDYNTALTLVNGLKDSSNKTALFDRLEVVNETIIAKEENTAIQNATEAVVKAESTLAETDYNSALSLVNALKDSITKTELLNRLHQVKEVIETQNNNAQTIQIATEAVVKAEKSLLLTDYNTALALVNALENSSIKDGLFSRLEAVKLAIDNKSKEDVAIQVATEAVVKAEKSLLLSDYSNALALVNALENNPTKTGLLHRLETVKNAIDDKNKEEEDDDQENTAIQIATEAVVKAEKSLLLSDYNSALALVNALNNSSTKAGLLGRLEVVKKAIEDKNKETEDNTENTAIAVATEAVVKAEKSLLLSDYNNALPLVNALGNDSVKAGLLNRLDAVKKAIDNQSKDNSIEEATNAVVKAERSLAYSDYQSALSFVRALVDSGAKTNLLSRLDSVKKAIDREDEKEEDAKADEEYYATKAVKTAERTLDEDDYEYAMKLVKRLSRGSVKTKLLQRLEDVNDEIDGLSNSFKETTKPAISNQVISSRNISDILALHGNGYNLGSIYAKGSSNKISGFISNPGAFNSVNNRNMLLLPIGSIATISGYSVSSDKAGNITLKNSENTLILKSDHFIYNGDTLRYQVAPIKRNGISYINAEFLAQYVELEISYTVNANAISLFIS